MRSRPLAPLCGFLHPDDDPDDVTGLSSLRSADLRLPTPGGGKYAMFEGGIRVNAFVSGGFLPASVRGTKLSEMIHIVDCECLTASPSVAQSTSLSLSHHPVCVHVRVHPL